MAEPVLKFNLPFLEISQIPDTKPPAIPALWNSRYTEITQNFKALSDGLNGNFIYKDSATGAAEIPSGTTAQAGFPARGRLRFNETTNQYEGGDGANWGPLGGGGMPRFTPYVWGGRGNAMPEGDTQSSGQQLLDLMYPNMRADVVATQFTCTEAEWQADPYKRVTHWSLGDGASWMRPPDKNGVQPGNVGAFYGAGSNPSGAKTGTAVIDAMRNITGSVAGVMHLTFSNTEGALSLVKESVEHSVPAGSGSAVYKHVFNAANALPAGTTTDPLNGEFRPRTWYGIWMIRMYGRVTNTGDLDAPALNARMDMIDARVSNMEGRHKALGDSQTRQDLTATRSFGVTYTNTTGRTIQVRTAGSTTGIGGSISLVAGGLLISHAPTNASGQTVSVAGDVLAGEEYLVQAGMVTKLNWVEVR